MNQHDYSIILLIGLILFSIYRRVSKSIGWQQLNQGKMLVRIVLSCIVGVIFLVEGASSPISLISDVVGILIGVVLAYYSTALTQFEQREGKGYYRPNNWIGFSVMALFFCRFVYRFYEMYKLGLFSGGNVSGIQSMGVSMGHSWTNGLLLIMFAYYIIYYFNLIQKQKQSHAVNE